MNEGPFVARALTEVATLPERWGHLLKAIFRRSKAKLIEYWQAVIVAPDQT